MGKNKLKRFQDNKSFSNVWEPTREELLNNWNLKGKWQEEVFKNSNPIILELGCGKGEYSVAMAEKYPDKNFIGIDIKGARFWVGAKYSIENKLENVAFLRMQIQDIEQAFERGEIQEIWITFPDPQIKYRRGKLRLTHPEFLKRYQNILAPKGMVHLKTDSEFLHGYTQGILQALEKNILLSQHDVYGAKADNIPADITEIQTHYEKLFSAQGKNISYLKFQLD